MMIKNIGLALNLINLSAEIGGIAECNSNYMAVLTDHIEKTGNPVEQLTLRELLDMHELCGERFNEMEKALEHTTQTA